MKTDIIICDCKSTEHQIVINFDDTDNLKMVYLHIHLANHKNFFKRLLIGIKYVFGYKSKYGQWDEFIITKDNYSKLKNITNFIDS